LENRIFTDRKNGKIIAFVPTMGALHTGHLVLVKEAQKLANVVVMSIFVNPTQFNDKSDLAKYPRTIEEDTASVKKVGLNYLYLPDENEVYPKNLNTNLNFDLLHYDKVMEGKFRPGHFQGVCQVVKRLLDLVKPDFLVMGQKDFQQFTIIQYMIDQLQLPVELHVVKTKRDKRGLALSSRNARLTETGRVKASVIYRTMIKIKKLIYENDLNSLVSYAMKRLNKAGLQPEYVSIVNGHDLRDINEVNDSNYVVVCIAAWLEGVRLIDNLILIDRRKIASAG
jgi:pantoate--beta-alanine ligase